MSEDPSRPAIDLEKTSSGDAGSGETGGSASAAFDPYRYGRPDHPVPPEYAPPGYVPDPPASPYSAANTPRSPYASPPQHPGYGQSGPGQSGYGQGGYGQQPPWSPPPAPYGNYPAPHQQTGGNGKAIAGMVLGIVSIVMCWLTFFNIVFLVLGLIFSILGMRDAKVRDGVGRGMALAGLICTAAGFVITAGYTVWALNVASKCGGVSSSSDPGFSDCVREHIR